MSKLYTKEEVKSLIYESILQGFSYSAEGFNDEYGGSDFSIVKKNSIEEYINNKLK